MLFRIKPGRSSCMFSVVCELNLTFMFQVGCDSDQRFFGQAFSNYQHSSPFGPDDARTCNTIGGATTRKLGMMPAPSYMWLFHALFFFESRSGLGILSQTTIDVPSLLMTIMMIINGPFDEYQFSTRNNPNRLW